MKKNKNADSKIIKKKQKLNDEFNKIFDLIKKEYTNHIYKLFSDHHYFFTNKGGDIILKFLHKKDQISKEELYDVLIDKFVNINQYKKIIKNCINREKTIEESLDIFEYFDHRMGYMKPSDNLKLNILEYQKNKMKIDNQEFYEKFLLATPINLDNITIPKGLQAQIKEYKKKYKELGEIEIRVNNDGEYFISIPNLFIGGVHAIISIESEFIGNLIIIYYEKLGKYFANGYRIEKIEGNIITQYKITKKGEVYIRRIKENLEFYKGLNL